jgi:hypothetical protein
MSPFWGSFFEHLRGCGRNTTLFFVVFAALFIALFAGMIASSVGLFRYADQTLAALTVLIVMWLGVGLYKARKRRSEPFRRRPLSSDEAKRARSKLLKQKRMNGPQQQY